MRLLVTAGLDTGRAYELSDGEAISIGRSTDIPNHLTDPRISRNHCTIEISRGCATIKDDDSLGGTFVNGHQIKTAVLKRGDVIRIGETELRFQADSSNSDESTVRPSSCGFDDCDNEISDDLSGMVGKILYHYRLERILAEGSTGTVFYARHIHRNRELAVKILYPSITHSDEETHRFIRAMKTMLPIQHPNIVQLYNAGLDKPYCWLSMEYIKGEALTETIRRIGMVGMLSWDHAFRIAVHIARALEFAAEHHIIHRNVTPRNIMIRKSDQVAKLGDLVLAKAFEGLQVDEITRKGQLIGDIAYMSPERTVGPLGVDTRSDIYGLGATIYAVLTGRPPFEDPSLPGLITMIRRDEPVRPKKFQLSINDMFEGIVLRSLAKRPEDRYQSATELLKDLNRVAKYQSISV